MNERIAMMEEWGTLSPSPNAFFSSIVGGDEQFSSGWMPQIVREATNGSRSVQSHQSMRFEDNNAKQGGISFDNDMIVSTLPDHRHNYHGALTDRIAPRAGFNAPCLNTESIRSTDDQLSTDVVKSPYFTIPPGINPAALLESSVLISNSLTQASATTGEFPLFPYGNETGSSMAVNGQSKEDFFDDFDTSSFAFKPHGELGLSYPPGTSNNMSQVMNPRAFPKIEVSVMPVNIYWNSGPSQVFGNEGFSWSLTENDLVERTPGSEIRGLETNSGTAERFPSLGDQQDDKGYQRASDYSYAGVSPGSPEYDDYNWRKYGQKQVKGSDFPRSYYKCMHLHCPGKKKVERSPEGIITEIIYSGGHNHPKPGLNRRSMGSSRFDDTHSEVGLENGVKRDSVWRAAQNGLLQETRELRNDSFEYNSLTSMNSELHNPSPLQMHHGAIVESGDAIDPLYTFSDDEEVDDRGTHGSALITNDWEGDESEIKRRKIETYAAEMGGGATRCIHESRVVVQTTSDVDIMDDGYRWRKYGQKVVKGNPNPRSYYKCTSVGCSVRKHVERASNDLKSVITSYEGKHNHEVPAARNISHFNSSSAAGIFLA
ncbi:unnamed protein product [Rhodiola kirilowii]